MTWPTNTPSIILVCTFFWSFVFFESCLCSRIMRLPSSVSEEGERLRERSDVLKWSREPEGSVERHRRLIVKTEVYSAVNEKSILFNGREVTPSPPFATPSCLKKGGRREGEGKVQVFTRTCSTEDRPLPSRPRRDSTPSPKLFRRRGRKEGLRKMSNRPRPGRYDHRVDL